MSAAQSVSIVEVGPRDGFQPIAPFIPTDKKIRIIQALHDAGLKRIEVGSFASAKAVPQLADAPEIVAAVAQMPGLEAQFLAPNERNGMRALEAGVRSLAFVISASAAHNQSNVRRDPLESAAEFRRLAASLPAGVRLRLNIATAFDCPFDGQVPHDDVVRLIEAADGPPEMELCLCDTTGRVTPVEIERLFSVVQMRFPHLCNLAFHGHDTYGMGIANVVAAWRSGVTVIDASVAGLGGCPFAPGATGNVATEDVVWLFRRLGVETGVDLERLLPVALEGAELAGASRAGVCARSSPPAALARPERRVAAVLKRAAMGPARTLWSAAAASGERLGVPCSSRPPIFGDGRERPVDEEPARARRRRSSRARGGD